MSRSPANDKDPTRLPNEKANEPNRKANEPNRKANEPSRKANEPNDWQPGSASWASTPMSDRQLCPWELPKPGFDLSIKRRKTP
jgi:hypothetical protein